MEDEGVTATASADNDCGAEALKGGSVRNHLLVCIYTCLRGWRFDGFASCTRPAEGKEVLKGLPKPISKFGGACLSADIDVR
jgi:hypothetical protein